MYADFDDVFRRGYEGCEALASRLAPPLNANWKVRPDSSMTHVTLTHDPEALASRTGIYTRGVWQAVIFDGDDTLWETEPLYDAARQRARKIVEADGLDGAEWEALERRRDVENVQRFGHTRVRFPTSCVEAYEQACSASGRAADHSVIVAIEAAARTAFEASAPLLPHAREALASLRKQGLRLALLTKGDRDVQRQRIAQSGLESLFDVIEIVDEKTPRSVQSVLDRLGVAPLSALSVGNSIRSDVLPSLAAGVQPVWIDAHVWEYERAEILPDPRVIKIEDLSELSAIVA